MSAQPATQVQKGKSSADNETTLGVLRLAAQGWPVIPVDCRTKRPLIEDWPNRAILSPEAIRATWGKRPGVGVGVVTGDGLVVIDLDVKGGADGPANWEKHLGDLGIDLPDTPVKVQTRSGGMHLYYAVPPGQDYGNSVGTVADGVDVRGLGGFVVAPPTPGYEFVGGLPDDAALPELPPVVLGRARRLQVAHEPKPDEYVFKAFLGKLDDLRDTAEGSRDNMVAKVAMFAADAVLDGQLDEATARGMIRAAALGMADPLPERQVAKAIDSGFATVNRKRPGALTEVTPSPITGLSGKWGYWQDTATYLQDYADLPAIWGPEESPLWCPGQSLMIAGDSGLGKSTLAVDLAAGRLGMVDEVLGYPVVDDGGVIVFLGLDRPSQLVGLLLRRFQGTDGWESVASNRLAVWEDLPVNLCEERNIDWLAEQALAVGATTLVIDSVKDVVLSTNDEMRVGVYNRVRQTLLRQGVNLIEVAHTRKPSMEGKGGRGGMADVLGSVNMTSGAGSVLTLSRPPGAEEDSKEVLLKQVKALRGDPHRARRLTLNKGTGRFEDCDEAESLEGRLTSLFFLSDEKGRHTRLLPREIYPMLFPDGGTSSQQSQVRRLLRRMVDRGDLTQGSDKRYGADF